MNRHAWRTALTIVSVAAIATTGWSLYAVARHYQAPDLIAGAAVAVFDGAAYACLHLSSEASKAGRSAAGARLATLAMTGTSVYLNVFHAGLIGGGLAAALLFAIPTLALLAVSELSWAGPRADAKAARGERPYRPPVFGGWVWMLAPRTAGSKVRERALSHIASAGEVDAPKAKDRTATAVLRDRFAEMDPAEAIQIAHDAQPDMPPGELAALLIGYGVIVDAVQVALTLGQRPSRVSVERVDAPDALQVSALPPVTVEAAVIEAASTLGPDAKARDIAGHLVKNRRLVVAEPYIRTALSREAKKAQESQDVDNTGPMRGGYA